MPGPPASAPGYPPAAPGPWRAGLGGRYREFRAHLASPLFRNAYALMLNTGATGLLGVAYWLLAARHYPAVDVGRASAAYSAMNLVSGITAFSILGAVTRFIPQAGRRTSAFVLRAYLFSSVASVIVSVLFLVNVSHWGASYAELRGIIPSLCFMACVIAWGIFTLQDGVLTGLRSAVWVPVENGTFGIVKIILLLAFAASLPVFGIDISWMLPVIVSLPLVNLLIFGKLIPDHARLTGDRRPPTTRQVGRFLAGDYIGALCVLAATSLVPIVVAISVGPNMTAYFYMAWTIGWVLFLVATNMATSLTVEGAFASETLLINCLAALRRMMRLLVPLAVATALLAPVALGLFGRRYAAYGTPILELLAIATLPKMLTELYLGALRAQSRTRQVAVIQIARCVLMLALALALTETMGLVGAGVAVLVSELAVAIVIFVVPWLKSAMFRGRRAVKAESAMYDQVNVRNPELRTAGDTLKPAPKVRSPEWLPVAVLCAAGAVGLALFLASLGSVTASLGRMNGLGLISVMPASTLAGVALLALAFVLALGLARPRPVLLGVMLAAIVVCLDGVTAIAEPLPRFPTAYWIAGFVEYVSRTGHTAPGLSAYFSWPGFFEVVAWVEHVAGSRNLMPVMRIWPLAVDLLALVLFGMILMRLRASWRAKWFAAFVFSVGNWVGQDYFSPQSVAYLLYLLIIALLLTWFAGSRPVQDGLAAKTLAGEPPRVNLPEDATVPFEYVPAEPPQVSLPDDATVRFELVPAKPPGVSLPGDPTMLRERVPAKRPRWAALLTRPIHGDLPSRSSTRVQRAMLLALIIVIFVFTTESHQLTPFFMIAACAGLVLVRRCQLPGLPVLFGVIFAAWVSFAAVAYWSGHLSSMFAGLGHLGSNVTSGVTDRISGSASVHSFVLYSRAAFAVTVIIFAVAGLVRRRRLGLDDRVAFVLHVRAVRGVRDAGLRRRNGTAHLSVRPAGHRDLGGLLLLPRGHRAAPTQADAARRCRVRGCGNPRVLRGPLRQRGLRADAARRGVGHELYLRARQGRDQAGLAERAASRRRHAGNALAVPGSGQGQATSPRTPPSIPPRSPAWWPTCEPWAPAATSSRPPPRRPTSSRRGATRPAGGGSSGRTCVRSRGCGSRTPTAPPSSIRFTSRGARSPRGRRPAMCPRRTRISGHPSVSPCWPPCSPCWRAGNSCVSCTRIPGG